MAKSERVDKIMEMDKINPYDAIGNESYKGPKGLPLLKIKKLHPNAVIPKYAKPGDAGLDLTCVESYEENGLWICKTGLAFEIPEGHFGGIYPRSSIKNVDLRLSNSVGVADSKFRGEVIAVFDFKTDPRTARVYKAGDRCCQLIIQQFQQLVPIEVEELSETERGAGGFGSSGR